MSENKPTQEQLEGIIGVLAHARLRPGMYIGSSDITAVRSFFLGFRMALHLVGIIIRKDEIEIERGWHVGSGDLLSAMKKEGFTDQQIITEVFSVEIIALIRQYNLSAEPVVQAHAKIRDTEEKGLKVANLDPETRNRYELELECMWSLEKDLGIQ